LKNHSNNLEGVEEAQVNLNTEEADINYDQRN